MTFFRFETGCHHGFKNSARIRFFIKNKKLRPFYPIFRPNTGPGLLIIQSQPCIYGTVFPQTARWALTDDCVKIQNQKRYSPFPARFPFVTFMSRGRDEADGEPVDDRGLVPADVPLIGLSADSPFSYSS